MVWSLSLLSLWLFVVLATKDVAAFHSVGFVEFIVVAVMGAGLLMVPVVIPVIVVVQAYLTTKPPMLPQQGS